MSSPAQVAANQANAQLSTGLKTEEGKGEIGTDGDKILLVSD